MTPYGMKEEWTNRLKWRPLEMSRFGRHFVADKPVHCGDQLELQLDDGSWARRCYEWNPPAGGDPTLDLGRVSVFLTKDSVVRWPP